MTPKQLREAFKAIIPILTSICTAGVTELGYTESDPRGEETLDQAVEALDWLLDASRTLKYGGKVLMLSKAEFKELSLAFGNSTADPDWYRSWAKNKKALLSVAQKVEATVLVDRKARRR